ncbi:phospholipase D-like domain-containing protein [Amphritea japonica]|uniref:PLD phosphodiesterase domain-containing protein n=1 Tax=Amphritea japonica ATCC BAA-1530 TaxID=1278309 RepID=A0A7R6P192_9GAMM|nr:phospholipase D-like domain-containing protein [Amphritea japonica]BBB24994.1 conserved hypothetical protein [Amphritea japonica ATCC BAA-1530]
MTAETTECKQVTTEAQLKATTAPKWLLCPETDKNVIYPHRENIEITPLINGKEAFGALEEAIKNATDSIDIICWGFDPSLRLSGPKGEERYGELLERKAKEGVQIRVMIWYSKIADISPMFKDESLPDFDRRTGGDLRKERFEKNSLNTEANSAELKELREYQQAYQSAVDDWRNQDLSTVDEPFWKSREYKADPRQWKLDKLKTRMEQKKSEFEERYNQAYTRYNGTPFLQQGDRVFNEDWYLRAQHGRIANLTFTTRDIKDFASVADMTDDSEMPFASKKQKIAGLAFPTHHQKMVLVDYSRPSQAVGFVMGHNMQKNYYDDDQHAFNSSVRYPGFRPWQDISTRARGSVLVDLNDNFSHAWDKEIPYDSWRNRDSQIDESRELMSPQQFRDAVEFKSGFRCSVAQICRTEEDFQDRSIRKAYERALNNTTDFVYSENQYFRYTPFAERLKKQALKRKQKGAKDLYWFVITNKPNSGGEGTNTYAMLQALGHEERLPRLVKDQRQQLIELEARRARYKKFLAQEGSRGPYYDYLLGNQTARVKEELPRVEKEIAELREHYPEAVAELEKKNQQVIKNELDVDDPQQAFELQNSDGLKVHIATLTSCTGSTAEPNLYTQIYVHSKLLLVDDDYFLLGSANINKRSMEIDTELAIATPTPSLASHCRNRLWQIHAKRVKKDSLGNYDYWDKLMTGNWRAQYLGRPLKGTLTHFYDPDCQVAAAND